MIDRRRMVSVGIAMGIFAPPLVCFAAERPTLSDMQPRALQIGATTDVVISGQALNDSLKLVCPLSGSLQVCAESIQPDQVQLKVTLAPDVAPGIYPLRLATDGGLSGAIAIGVDRLPQRAFTEMLDGMPVALHGRLAGHRVLQTQFDGKAGERLVVEVEAQRLGSRLRPALRLYSPANRLIEIAQPTRRIGGDARIDIQLPDDGRYRLELQDIVFDAGDANWFRLKIGNLQYADGVFPLAVSRTTGAEVSLINAGPPVIATLNPQSWRALNVPVRVDADSDAPFTGALPYVHLSPPGTSEWTEDEARGGGAERLAPPLGINGRLATPGEQDDFDIRVPPGEKLNFEVHADRWGSPLDAVMVVSRPDGQTLAESDDQAGSSDPQVDVDVPADVERVRVRVASRVGQGGEAFVYRLSVGPSRRPTPLLEADGDGLNLPAGDTVVLPFQIDHRGDPQRLRLSLPSVLEHVVTMYPQQLDATDEVGLVSFTAAPDARGIFRGWLQANFSEGPEGGTAWLRSGRFPGSDYQPHWREDLMIAVTPPGALGLDWADEGPAYLVPGTTRPLDIVVERRAGVSGSVRLSLLTSQRPPQKQVNGQTQPDEERTIRLAEAVTISADVDRGQVRLVTPSELALHAWSFAIKAELLGADGEQILATAYTPLRRWSVVVPLKITWDATSPLTVAAGDPAGRVVRGRVERHPDFKFPVEVRVVGLPEADTPPPVTVATGESDFELTLKFATDAPAREMDDVRLLAVPVEPSDAHREVSGRSEPVKVTVTRGESP